MYRDSLTTTKETVTSIGKFRDSLSTTREAVMSLGIV